MPLPASGAAVAMCSLYPDAEPSGRTTPSDQIKGMVRSIPNSPFLLCRSPPFPLAKGMSK